MITIKEPNQNNKEAIEIDEELLQALLEQYPSLLSIGQQGEYHQDSWLFIEREVEIPTDERDICQWYLDHLFLDNNAVPTLVEVKCASSTKIRREVIGQMLDYAANAIAYWPIEIIQTKFEATCLAKGKDSAQLVARILNVGDKNKVTYERYWKTVEANINSGQIRLVLLADILPNEIKHIIRFMDKKMETVEVWAVEIGQFINENPGIVKNLILPKRDKPKKEPNLNDLYGLAEDQAGYFTTYQANEAGFSRPLLTHHVNSENFIRIDHGIYRFRRFPASPFEDLFIAWLRTGPKSVISHESALAVYGLSDVIPTHVHVIIPRTASRRRKGLRLHTNRLQPNEITYREGLPITTVERTIADVARSGLAEEFVYQAIHEALQRGMTSQELLMTQSKRRRGRARRLIHNALEFNNTS